MAWDGQERRRGQRRTGPSAQYGRRSTDVPREAVVEAAQVLEVEPGADPETVQRRFFHHLLAAPTDLGDGGRLAGVVAAKELLLATARRPRPPRPDREPRGFATRWSRAARVPAPPVVRYEEGEEPPVGVAVDLSA